MNKRICYFGIGIALYVVLGMACKIPLIGHIQTDLGYIVFGAFCMLFGWQAFIVGTFGCMIESLLVSGWIPIGWMVGQAIIGILCGLLYNNNKKISTTLLNIVITIAVVILGVGVIKTIIECQLYSIPLEIKLPKNIIASIADIITMIIGMFLGQRLIGRAKTQ